MRWAYHYRKPFTRQLALCEAFQAGAAAFGQEVYAVEGFHGVERKADGLILFGIGGVSREVLDSYLMAGKRAVFLDKGYTTRNAMYRVAVNAWQPLAFVANAKKSSDRWAALGVDMQPYRRVDAGNILFDGASNKYCLFQGLGDWVLWGDATLTRLRQHSKREVVYRPRPSHNIREMLPPLSDQLASAALVASYGGNIGFDCVVRGIPHFAIGDSVARCVSETDWRRLDELYIPSDSARRQWLANVAHCQWSLDEIRNGAIWSHVMEQL